MPLVAYVFHIRAWYNPNQYSNYISDGIYFDETAPEISRSERPVEVRSEYDLRDIDFIDQNDSLTVSWKYVFRDAQSNITNFTVMIGSDIGKADIKTLEYPGFINIAIVKELSLKEGVRYFTTVKATNAAGLFSYSHSDGFEVSDASYRLTPFVVKESSYYKTYFDFRSNLF